MQSLAFIPATLIGIGAIVGGGIFVLGGVAFVEAGPAALLAFVLNGILALLTARSYAGLSRLFPESGGTYVYAKRILSVRAAFVVGWMLWLAHIVAALLYALGFSAYFASILSRLLSDIFGIPPSFLGTKVASLAFGGGACGMYTVLALRRLQSGGAAANVIKLVLFTGLILLGGYAVVTQNSAALGGGFRPFFPTGAGGVLAAMGYTFIALQGFELIAASSGEINDPGRTVARAMYSSLGVALAVYLPLLVVILAVGIPEGSSAREWCATRMETCVADATYTFLGPVGYWIVSITAIAATLSALQANLIASSAIARTMALDRTLPRTFATLHERFGTPEVAILVNFVIVIFLIVLLPDAAAAGSAASLAFLICFACAHLLAYLAQSRVNTDRSEANSRKLLLQRAVPIFSSICCLGLAAFQLSIEQSGAVVLFGWVCVGGLIYYVFLSVRAEALDAYSAATNPTLAIYRGYAPIVVVPISNPARVRALSGMAQVIAPRGIGRVLLLSVAIPKGDVDTDQAGIVAASQVVSQALQHTARGGRERVEGIVAINRHPWRGIQEVASTYKCETLLLGFSGENALLPASELSNILCTLSMNVVILSAPPDWEMSSIKRVLVPIAGKGEHDLFRARILGGLSSTKSVEEIIFLRILPVSTSESSAHRVRRGLERRVADEVPRLGRAQVEFSDSVVESILQKAGPETLIILGLSGRGTDRSAIGSLATEIAREQPGGVLIIRHGR